MRVNVKFKLSCTIYLYICFILFKMLCNFVASGCHYESDIEYYFIEYGYPSSYCYRSYQRCSHQLYEAYYRYFRRYGFADQNCSKSIV